MRLSIIRMLIFTCFVLLSVFNIARAVSYNPPERIMVVRPTIEGHTERVLRYRPDGTDFVIENGEEFFNRSLYGGNTAFRVDAGDKPEFSLYLPGHGGNLRFGIRAGRIAKWLHEADTITSRYRPGAMIYEIRDNILKDATLHISVMGLYDADGLIVEIRLQGTEESIELIAAYGGASGKRGRRSGDIGCEKEPVSKFFQLKPESCKDNRFSINDNTFVLKSKRATITGVFPDKAMLTIADAQKWNVANSLLASTGKEAQYTVITSIMPLSTNTPIYTTLARVSDKTTTFEYKDLPALYEKTETQRRAIAHQVSIETPDPFINSAAAALCIAADAIWDDEQGSVMHGAVAWRSKYLGWRGPYTNDVFGWHDRAKRHFTYWAEQQDTSPVPDKILPADPTAHLARNEPSLHSNGALSHKHYDMNLVYMDALFRHILWTGDMDLVRELWPEIERHMDWERRLFRRPFGEDKLPLYEAYAAIWASDDLQYHGGGVTHASAYNYYHNLTVARFAKELGKDPTPYETEAELIYRAMNEYLWLEDCGWYAEFKDLLGLQSTHPNAALWTFYHTLDSEAANPLQSWQMSRFVDTQIAHIPVYGGDIPRGKYFTLPTTSWMPYTWSTNNVVMAEVAHTALAYWQAQRPDKAYALFKGCLLDSMYMGKCPGNAGMTTYFDMARGEAQRDFGDAVGITTRALIEGLFGVCPDVPAGELKITPGFPREWEFAKIQHPDFRFSFERKSQGETYTIKSNFSKPMALKLKIKVQSTQIENLTVNGLPAQWTVVKDNVGRPAIEILSKPMAEYKISVSWSGEIPVDQFNSPVLMNYVNAKGDLIKQYFAEATVTGVLDPENSLSDVEKQSHAFTAKATGALGHHTVFACLEQDQMHWIQPVIFQIRERYEIIAQKQQEADGISFQIQDNTNEGTVVMATIHVSGQSIRKPLKIPAKGLSKVLHFSVEDFDLLPGSNRIHIDMGDGNICDGTVTNWNIPADTERIKWEPVDIAFKYNGKITDLFENEYLSPRSPYCSLAIPRQGIGSWCNFAKTFDIDDDGLRAASQQHNGIFILPQGIRFKIPVGTDANNTVFTSQWDNYPDEKTIELIGKARHIYLLMAGSTNSMQSRFDNGEVIVTYKDGSVERLALHNPTTWWPIDQDYFIDDFGFRRPEMIPPRVDLKTGKVRISDMKEFKGKGGTVPGGAATVLDMPLDPKKTLHSLTLRAMANEVVIGLLSATLVR